MAPCVILVESLQRSTVLFQTKYVEEITKATVRGLRNLLVTEGFKTKLQKERVAIDHIVDLFVPLSNSQAVKAVKYLTAYQLPRLVGDIEPERPEFLTETSTLFAGTYAKFITNRLRGRAEGDDPVRHKKKDNLHGASRRQLSLCMSILQLKRYLPPLPKDLQLEAKVGCRKRLTTPGFTPERLLCELERTANELFPLGWDTKTSVPSFSVTNKSCFESSRSAGGAQSYMFNHNEARSNFNQVIDFNTWNDDLLKWSGVDLGDLPVHPSLITPEEYIDRAIRTMPSELKAKMEIVEDPLKARVITKNNWNCTILKILQKMIHTVLREHEAFELIGAPLTEEIINKLVRFKGSKYVSGDYEAATDNFHSDATETVLDRILGNMTGKLSENPGYLLLAKKSLTGLTIVDSEVGTFRMERGQLMGSLLSFPILCIVNFAVWRFATEQTFGVKCDGKGLGGIPDRVLINGDDIGFCATVAQHALWMSLTPQVGLKPSMGKNYFADEFITLNTQLYSWVENKGLVLIRFLNQGLLINPGNEEISWYLDGQNANSVCSKLESLGPMHDDFVKGAVDKCAASAMFISHHKHLLKQTWRNLFGPREHGGLGGHPVKDHERYNSSEGYSCDNLSSPHCLKMDRLRCLQWGSLRDTMLISDRTLLRGFRTSVSYQKKNFWMLPMVTLGMT